MGRKSALKINILMNTVKSRKKELMNSGTLLPFTHAKNVAVIFLQAEQAKPTLDRAKAPVFLFIYS